MTPMKLSTVTIALLALAGVGSLQAAESPSAQPAAAASKEPSTEPSTEPSKDASKAAAPAPAASATSSGAEGKPSEEEEKLPPAPATAADKKASPQRFVPSEQVRADFDVSFPIDI